MSDATVEVKGAGLVSDPGHNDVRRGEIWELRMEPRVEGFETSVLFYTVREVDGDSVIFEEILTASRYESASRRHMLSSPDWSRVPERGQ